MAESSGEISNFSPEVTDLLFQTLADWNEQLKHSGIELPIVPIAKAEREKPSSTKPRNRGPRPTPSVSN